MRKKRKTDEKANRICKICSREAALKYYYKTRVLKKQSLKATYEGNKA